MAIYTRDNINYGGMLGNAMQARANQIQRDYDNYMKQPLAWANAVNQTGQTINDAFKLAAQYSHDDSKLAAQQQFQAEQNAKNLAEQLNRAREQQAWQATQNDLQRASTERIAEMNNKNSAEERRAQNVMNYQNQETIIRQLEFEYNNTSNKTPEGIMKRNQLESQIQQAKNKRDYYGSMIPEVLRTPPEGGTPVITGEDAEEALGMFGTAMPKTAAEIAEDNKEFDEIMKSNILTDEQKARAITLAGDDKAKLERIEQKGATVEARKADSAKKLKDDDADFQKMTPMDQDIFLDNHPAYIRVNGHLAYKSKR